MLGIVNIGQFLLIKFCQFAIMLTLLLTIYKILVTASQGAQNELFSTVKTLTVRLKQFVRRRISLEADDVRLNEHTQNDGLISHFVSIAKESQDARSKFLRKSAETELMGHKKASAWQGADRRKSARLSNYLGQL